MNDMLDALIVFTCYLKLCFENIFFSKIRALNIEGSPEAEVRSVPNLHVLKFKMELTFCQLQ